ncbi:hypothetical protein OG389_35705 [Streptomyces sp. NBC_00435]|uniref:hypothetical protein n=1 Tax=Streptomyces sp. NBC_00435 TaxID=2903649 RepID=UPI002E23EC30
MTLFTVLILVAVPVLVLLLALAPSAPTRSNPFPGRRHRAARTRSASTGRRRVPGQRGVQHQTR